MRPRWHALFEELRARLHERPGRTLTLPGIHLREAAVLVPLVVREGSPHVLVTKRPQTLRAHAGQFSFPGGSRDPSDATLLHTALRESQEEMGIPPERVEILGALDEMPTITEFRVTPYVGVLPEDLSYRPNPEEIELYVEVPLGALLHPGARRDEFRGTFRVTYFDYGPHVVWGATARMLLDLFERARGLPSFEALRTC